MAKIIAEPRRPVKGWEKKLADWVDEIEKIVDQAKFWAEARGWAVSADEKQISEDIIGTYEAPRLLIHSPRARFLLDPVARYVVGASGRLDLCVLPSYDAVLLVKTDKGWRFVSTSRRDLNLAWSEKSFGKVCDELTKMQ